MRFAICLFFLQLFPLCCFGKDPVYKHYNTSNGLSSSQIYDIIQDSWGNLWFSSDYGLNRFDGYQFKQYSSANGLTDNTIFKFKKDKTGRIWCTAFNNTLFVIEGKDTKFYAYPFNATIQEIAVNKIINEIYFDFDNNLYITFLHTHGYLKIGANGKAENNLFSPAEKVISIYINWQKPENSFVFSTFSDTLIQPLKNHKSTFVTIPNSDKFPFCFSGALQFQKEKISYYFYNRTLLKIDNSGVKTVTEFNTPIREIRKLDQGNFWISTEKEGIFLYDKFGNLKINAFKGENITCIYPDHEGGIWVSTTANGVYHIKDWSIQNIDPYFNEFGVSDLLKDKQNRLWIAYENGNVSSHYNGVFETHSHSRLVSPSHLFYDSIRNITYYSSNYYLHNSVNKDSAYLGSHNGFHVYSQNHSDSIFVYSPNALFFMKSPNYARMSIVQRCRIYGATKYKNENYYASKFGLYKILNDSLILANEYIPELACRFDAITVFKNLLVLGSRGQGIIIYDQVEIRKITKDEGLSSNYISNFYIENDSTIWVCTNSGLNRVIVKKNTLDITVVSVDDGLISNEITAIEIIQDTLWVGTREGLSFFPKENIKSTNRRINYHLKLNKILVNDKQVKHDSIIHLSHTDNRLEFRFSGVSFIESNPLQYRYKLLGLDKSWHYTKNLTIVYSALPPSEYEFIVQLKGENTNWNFQEKRVVVIIYPPYWRTWWFISLISVTLLVLIYLFFKYRVLIYNGDVLREILRQILKKIRNNNSHIIIKESGRQLKIDSASILYVKSDGNYLEIHTDSSKHVVRGKISNFLKQVPDPLEFIRIKRSFIVRIDKVQEKGKKYIVVNKLKIDVGLTYIDELDKIHL